MSSTRTIDGSSYQAVVCVDSLGNDISGGGGGGGGAVTVADGADVAQGATTQAAAAAAGTGDYSLIQAAKRALLNWAVLLARIPALVSGRVPVDGSGVTQPISSASLTSIDGKTPALVSGMSPVDVLLVPSVPRQLAAEAASTNQALTTTCRRISITARDASIRFSIGSTSQTASGTSHYIWQGERLEFAVPSSPNIAAIRAGTINGTLEITEFLPIS